MLLDKMSHIYLIKQSFNNKINEYFVEVDLLSMPYVAAYNSHMYNNFALDILVVS